MRPYSQMGPQARIESLRSLNQRLRDSPRSMAILREWGFQLDEELIRVSGRQLDPLKVLFNIPAPYVSH